MTRVLRRTGERLLGVFVPKLDAGACVPEHNQCCPNTNRRKRYNCYGSCYLNHC